MFNVLGFEGVIHYSNIVHEDFRGSFVEIFNFEKLQKLGLNPVMQLNVVKSKKYVVRGMHWQIPPFQQSKLISVIQGKLLDVFIDLRRESETYLKSGSLELNSETNDCIFIPKGFAHGYQALSDNTIVAYSVDNKYSPQHERFLNPESELVNSLWNNPKLINLRDSKASLTLNGYC
jgi:dTDP-4-dehydrorhamnose 3,5-epimerase